MKNTRRIESLSELLDEIDKIEVTCNFVKEEKLVYRGQGNVDYELIPSIGRFPNGCIGNSLLWFESNIYEEARNAFPKEFNINLKPVDFLAKLQHYGIPTRFLDVTEDPLVAAYFACSDVETLNKDAELFVFKIKNTKPTYNAISDAIADTAYNRGMDLNDFLRYSLSKSYFDDERQALLNILEQDPNYGNSWIAECCKQPIYINRSFLTNRQQIQKGAFLLFSNEIVNIENSDRKNFSDKIKPLNKENDEIIIRRFIIPSNKKIVILNQLNKIGINRRTLFADSIDIVCQEIKKHYIDDRFKLDF